MEVNNNWKVKIKVGGKELANINEIAAQVGPYTVYEAFDLFIENAREKLSSATIKNYEHIKEKHLGSIMLVPLQMLTESDIQHAFQEELDKGYKVKTVKNYKTLLKKVLEIYRPDFQFNVTL